jgi:hypothetical protein
MVGNAALRGRSPGFEAGRGSVVTADAGLSFARIAFSVRIRGDSG